MRRHSLLHQVLSDVLCGSNHAPLCRAILEQGLAEDVVLSCDEQCMQPNLLLRVQNSCEADLPLHSGDDPRYADRALRKRP